MPKLLEIVKEISSCEECLYFVPGEDIVNIINIKVFPENCKHPDKPEIFQDRVPGCIHSKCPLDDSIMDLPASYCK